MSINYVPGFATACTQMHEHDPIDCAPEDYGNTQCRRCPAEATEYRPEYILAEDDVHPVPLCAKDASQWDDEQNEFSPWDEV